MKQIDKLKDAATNPLKYGIGCTSLARQSIKELLTNGKTYTAKSGYSKGWKTKSDWTNEVTKVLDTLKISYIIGNDSTRGGANTKFVKLTGKQLIKDINNQKNKAMKLRIKQNQIDKNMCIQLGYCSLCNLLSFFTPYWYTCGVYGWNSDIYFHDGYFISTGYRPIGKIDPSYEIVKKYNEQARKIATSSSPNRQKEIENLLSQFIKEVTQ